MNISAAKFYLPESEGRKPQALGNYDKLSGPFSAAINHSEIKVPNNKALYAVNTDQYGETDALFFNPYDKTLQQRIFEKIANGVHGEALDLLFKHLDGRDPEYTRETLEYFRDEFEDRGLDALALILEEILSYELPMLDLSDLHKQMDSLAAWGVDEDLSGLADGITLAKMMEAQNIARQADEVELLQAQQEYLFVPAEPSLIPAPRFF